MTQPTPTYLRVEYLENPLGIDVRQPRLSWILEDAGPGMSQTAYQVLAASTREALDADQGDRWDSGKVESAACCQVVYEGAALASRDVCWWKVRVWTGGGEPGAFSVPAKWTMGLLGPDEWRAEWLGYDAALDVPEKGPEPMTLDERRWVVPVHEVGNGETVVFRKSFDLPSGSQVKRARLVASSGGQFDAYVNGRQVGSSDGRFWAWQRPVQMDVTAALRPGANALGIATTLSHCPAAGAIAKLVVEFDRGETFEVTTDASWRVAAQAAAGSPEQWASPGFDARSWDQAKEGPLAGTGPWGQLGPAPLEVPPCPMLRTTLTIEKPVESATLYATALGCYEFRLNGAKAGDDLFPPGWSDYRKRLYYHTYDVTGMLREGENAWGAVLGHGWFSGYMGWHQLERGYYGKHPRLRGQLEVRYADGTSGCFVTDSSWRAAHGPVIGSDIYAGEWYDARREAAGWDEPGFDDSAWMPPETGSHEVEPALQAYPGVPVRAVMEIGAREVTEHEPGVYIFDLGQNIVGWARLKVSGPAGTKVRLRFAEMLDPATGGLYLENLRGARATDYYWLRGDGEEVWEPRFTFHGFRYVEVMGYPGQPDRDAVTGVVIHSDTPAAGTFECSNPMVNQLQSNIQWGQRGNFLEVPTDCPQRDERLGWLGDAQVFARTASFNMDTSAFFTKWMRDVEDAQSEQGGFPDVAPRVIAENDGAPAWGDAGVIVPWTMYLCYGDTRILDTHYDAMCRWLDYCRMHNIDLVRRHNLNNNYGDWLSIDAPTPKDLIATAYFARSASLMARIAAVLGRDNDAAGFEELHGGIRQAFISAFVNADGQVKGDTQTGYVLALRFGLLPEDLRTAAAARLVELIEARDWHLSTGFTGCPNLLFALTDSGHLDVAYRLLLNDTFPSWGYSIRHGATTIWERWDGWTEEKGFQDPGMNSFNHYAYGAVGEWLFRCVAGIDTDPAHPGYEHIVFRPRPAGGLRHARGDYDSIRGGIQCEWRIEDGVFRLRTAVPANSRGTVYLPGAEPDAQRQVIEPGAGPVEAQAGQVFGLEPGSYEFRCRWE